MCKVCVNCVQTVRPGRGGEKGRVVLESITCVFVFVHILVWCRGCTTHHSRNRQHCAVFVGMGRGSRDEIGSCVGLNNEWAHHALPSLGPMGGA